MHTEYNCINEKGLDFVFIFAFDFISYKVSVLHLLNF